MPDEAPARDFLGRATRGRPDGKRILSRTTAAGSGTSSGSRRRTTPRRSRSPMAFDRRNARWSPDGKRIAYVSNEVATPRCGSGRVRRCAHAVLAKSIHRIQPAAFLLIRPVDRAGMRVARGFRSSAATGAGMRRAMPGCTATNNDRSQFPSEVHYFHCPAKVHGCQVNVPPGKTTIHVESGFHRKPAIIERAFPAGDTAELEIGLEDNDLPAYFGKFLSADLHVHMNYGGHYRSTPETLLAQQDAEDLDVVYNLLVNKEERIPDIGYFKPGGTADAASGTRLLFHAQEYHTSFWGHMGLLNLEDHYLLPDYMSYRHTALASPWPNNGAIADLAHAQGALVGYVHVADLPIDPPKEKTLSYELPADVAMGKVDYMEVMGFSDHHITAGSVRRTMACSSRRRDRCNGELRVAPRPDRPGAGVPRHRRRTHARRAQGRAEVRPHVRLQLRAPRPHGRRQAAGRWAAPRREIPGARLDALAGRDGPPGARAERAGHQDLRVGGRPHAVRLERRSRPRRRLGGAARLQRPGKSLGVDLYPYATTGPIYVNVPGPPAPEDAAYFVAWMDRVVEAALARGGWNSEQEKTDTLAYLNAAREKYRALAAPRRTN